jgi:hypothetical protein
MWNIKPWLLVCEVFFVSVLWHLQRFGMLVMHLWSKITLRSLRTNRLLYCPVAVWMFARALSERACLKGLVGVRTLCVYLDLPLDASLPFWLHLNFVKIWNNKIMRDQLLIFKNILLLECKIQTWYSIFKKYVQYMISWQDVTFVLIMFTML